MSKVPFKRGDLISDGQSEYTVVSGHSDRTMSIRMERARCAFTKRMLPIPASFAPNHNRVFRVQNMLFKLFSADQWQKIDALTPVQGKAA